MGSEPLLMYFTLLTKPQKDLSLRVRSKRTSDRKDTLKAIKIFCISALLLGEAGCRATTPISPPPCDPRDETGTTRFIDGRCVLVNSTGYRIGRQLRPMPLWHDYVTREARAQDPSHPILCNRGCVELELVFVDWQTDDEPVVRLAVNPANIWTDVHFPLSCVRGTERMTCHVRMVNGTTTIVDIPRYTIMPGATRGTYVDVRGRLLARYRGQPVCTTRIGIGLYAIQAPLVDARGEVMGSSHTWCETYTHP